MRSRRRRRSATRRQTIFRWAGALPRRTSLLLNGVPNMQDSSRLAGFSPELDSVDAVHVDEFAANAALGDTSGGTVNITTKSGTNDFHGSVVGVLRGVSSADCQALEHTGQHGGSIDPFQPVWRDDRRTRFGYRVCSMGATSCSSSTRSRATTGLRRRRRLRVCRRLRNARGDFSQLLGISNASNQLYNPYSGVLIAVRPR